MTTLLVVMTNPTEGRDSRKCWLTSITDRVEAKPAGPAEVAGG